MTKKVYLKAPIKSLGSKHHIANWIIEYFPKNYLELKYCEPFCAGASVFLNKEPSPEETISDIDRGLICIFKALRDEPKEFISKVKRIKYTENTFNRAYRRSQANNCDYIDQAIIEYVLRRMSRGGLKKSFYKNNETSWLNMNEHLSLLAKRIDGVNIINSCFKDVFKVWDEADTLTYLDPPMLPDKNATGCDEITIDDHIAMLTIAKIGRGKIIISGHPSPLYNRHLADWRCVKTTHSTSKKVEMLWMNYKN